MDKQLLLIRYGELGLKGKNKNIFISKLVHNIRASMRGMDNWAVRSTWGRIWLEVAPEQAAQAIERLRQVFGIYSLSPVVSADKEIPALAEEAFGVLRRALPAGGSFKVETRRADKSFPMTSPEISRSVASLVFERLAEEGLGGYEADMRCPQAVIDIEVRGEGAFVYGETIACAGGLPVSSGGKALLLLSGGIDSPVAGWLAMKRGVAIEAVHFHSFPFTGEKSKEKVMELCRVLARWQGAPIKLHVVHFTEIQKAIYSQCKVEYGITIMRRMMYRIAGHVAEQRRCLALYTGESVGQVASQTLESIAAINPVATLPVLRPLVGMDKEDIMRLAQELGSFDISILPYEDCCTVFLPKYPKIRPLKAEAEAEEELLDIDGLIAEALAKTETLILGQGMAAGKR